MTDVRPLHVLIAGGGLSGLALAQGLIKDGHTVKVFERDPDLNRKQGYYLHMNPFGGHALQRLLPADLYALYLETSRTTYDRKASIVLSDQLEEVTSQPHKGPPNDGPRNHTGIHRRTLRQILMARLGDSFLAGVGVASYDEDPNGVTVTLTDGSIARGDVLVGADGIRSAVRAQRLPDVAVVPTGIAGIGVYGRTPLTDDLAASMPEVLHQGVLMTADRNGHRCLLGSYQPRQAPDEAAATVAPDVTLDPVAPYIMVTCSVEDGTVVPPTAEWTPGTAAEIRASQQRAVAGWHPVLQRIVAEQELDSLFMIPFGYVDVPDAWAPSRVTLIGDAVHAMLPTLGMGANLALFDSGQLCDQLGGAARGEVGLVEAIGTYEAIMREVVYPFHRMTLSHDENFGGGGLAELGAPGHAAPATQ